MFNTYILIFSLLLIQNIFYTNAYTITVDPHAEECFFDQVEFGSKMRLMFEIAEGGFLDINVKIVGPKGRIIFACERDYSVIYTFWAYMDGRYTYCFSNQMSTTPKVVLFYMEIVESPNRPPGAKKEDEAGHTKLEDMIRELSGTLTGVKREQEFMQVRDRIHRAINESTNSRVVLWSVFEATVLLAMTVGQVYYLKRFSEVRRVV